jgi:hypothetical protein
VGVAGIMQCKLHLFVSASRDIFKGGADGTTTT